MATPSPAFPLAAASQRLRGKPGRPRKHDKGQAEGTPGAGDSTGKCREDGATARTTITPRLLTFDATAAYLGVSPWTVRDLEAARVLRRVCIPLPGGRDLRKLLFDRADLDRLVEAWKEPER